MVLFVNLSSLPLLPPPPPPTAVPTAAPEAPPLRHPPNRNHPLSALLATYPFLSSLARSLDHNDLYNLSSACWQFHANLSEYRKTLLSLSLRCGNDKPSADPDGEFDWRRLRGGRRCARDLVRGCLRCGTPVCRNCIDKPHVAQIHSRHRRLCQTCRFTPALLIDTQKRCSCMNGGWLCTLCAPVVTQIDDASRMWSTMSAREYLATGRGSIGCARGIERCEGATRAREAVAMGAGPGEKGSEWKKVAGGVPVVWGDEMADNRWALVDEWKGMARSWCSWCDSVILSREDEKRLEQYM